MQHTTLTLMATAALAVMSLTATAAERTPAFPGAEGFGRYTTGGRGGKVYHVTKLTDDGSTGTLRWANSQAGPRTIVFDVSGTIFLKSAMKIANNTTLAGQTAPGDGICVADYPVTLGSNVICRYMRFRLGNREVANHEGDGLGSMDDNNIIVDHCSVSWSIDECLSVYGGRNLTVQWCITSQSLVDAGHAKGKHGYGGNWGGSGASYHHNLIAHHTSRTPRLGPRQGTQTDERMDMRNNVIYNWGGNGCYGGEGMRVNIVNNYYKPGPGTPTDNKGRRIASVNIRTSEYTNHNGTPNGWDVMWHVWGKYYVTGNVNSKYSDVTKDNWTYGMYNQIDASGNDGTYTQKTKDTIRLADPIDFVCVTTHTAEQAYERVLSYVGCSLHRDALDDIIVSDTRSGTATFTGSGNSRGFINSQNDVKSKIATLWPELSSTTAPADSDGDGMPDEWERQHGLDPADAADGNATTADGYTNLEDYLNSIVADITARQNEGGEQQGYTEQVIVPGEGEAGMKTVSAGNVSWHFDTGSASQTASYSADTDYYLTATFTLGSTLSVAGTQKSGTETMTKIQPQNRKESAATDGNALSFCIDMADGYYFRPTNVSFNAIRCGTDGGRVDLYWKNANGKKEIEVGFIPERNAYSHYSRAISDIASAPGRSELLLHVLSLDNKQYAFSNITIAGDISMRDAAGISETHSTTVHGRTYSLKGIEVKHPANGIAIRNNRKYINRQ